MRFKENILLEKNKENIQGNIQNSEVLTILSILVYLPTDMIKSKSKTTKSSFNDLKIRIQKFKSIKTSTNSIGKITTHFVFKRLQFIKYKV